MSRRALILAAHGSRADASVNEDVRRCARRVAGITTFDEVVAAFHAGEPSLADVLDRVEAERVTVVPLMTSAGYYFDVVLPRELARNRSHAGKSVCITRPVGEHPALPAMVVALVQRRLRLQRLAPEETSLVIVGHGTRRHAHSRQATIDLVAAVQGIGPCREVLPAFLDEAPEVDTILARATARNLLVLPFLISGGWHATRDIPKAVGLTGAAGLSLPVSGCVGDRWVVCEPAIGTHLDIAALVADLAEETEATFRRSRLVTGVTSERIV